MRPGSGLHAYNLSARVGTETLYICKRFPGRYAEPPRGTHLAVYVYWEPHVSPNPSRAGKAWLAIAKSAGAASFLLQAAPAILRFRPDVVHLHSVLTVPFAPFARWVTRTPVAMTFHGTDFLWFRENRFLQRLVERNVDLVFCVSRGMAEEMRRLVSRPRVVPIPNGVDLDVFSDRGFERRRQIVAVGQLKWQKGYEYLLEAMRLVADRLPDVRLLIAGSGHLEQPLRDRAVELGLSARVQLLGSLPHSEIADLLASSRLYVMSSVSEGFPKALLEALACGTPVVVTDVGECAAIAQNTGSVVPPGEPKSMANAIIKLMEDDAAWAQSARNALQCAREFSWDEVARLTAEAYEDLLGRPAAKPSTGWISDPGADSGARWSAFPAARPGPAADK